MLDLLIPLFHSIILIVNVFFPLSDAFNTKKDEQKKSKIIALIGIPDSRPKFPTSAQLTGEFGVHSDKICLLQAILKER